MPTKKYTNKYFTFINKLFNGRTDGQIKGVENYMLSSCLALLTSVAYGKDVWA